MRSRAITPHRGVNRTLQDLLARARSTLGDRFFGLYLYGSLALGDFDPQRSDIDFVVVTHDDPPSDVVDKLRSTHMILASTGLTWAQKLEGTYMSLEALRIHRPGAPPRPTVHEGRFYLGTHGWDWVIHRKTLREHPSAVAGPSLRNHIDPVKAEDLQRAVAELLRGRWAPMLSDPSPLGRAEYQPFAVLTICRALYTLENATLVSKSNAARWAMDTFDDRWVPLIQNALSWRSGGPPGDPALVLDFICHALARARQG